MVILLLIMYTEDDAADERRGREGIATTGRHRGETHKFTRKSPAWCIFLDMLCCVFNLLRTTSRVVTECPRKLLFGPREPRKGDGELIRKEEKLQKQEQQEKEAQEVREQEKRDTTNGGQRQSQYSDCGELNWTRC